MPTIPAQSDDVTSAWMNDVLAGHTDVGRIASVRAENMGEGVGILGEVARLHLTYEPGSTGPATMVAKFQSRFPENVFVSQIMGFYLREVNFYNDLAPTLGLAIPRCFHASIDPAGTPFVILMEEITGARMIDQITGATLDDCERIVDLGAALHAKFWETPQLYALQWLPPWNNPAYQGARELVSSKIEAFDARWSARVPSDAMAWMHEMTPRYVDMLDWWVDRGNVTLAHTDFRADNFLFGGSPGEGVVTMLDFQIMTRHVGAWDIANFLGMSVTAHHRREWQDELLRRYHGALTTHGVTGYSFERLVEDYRFCTLQQAWAQIAISDADPGNERGRILLDSMITRSFESASDNAGGEALERF